MTSRKIPTGVIFIVFFQFCERYGTSGLNGILAIFFYKKVGFDEDLSTALVHYFLFALYFASVIGAYCADSWIGKYKSMIYMAVCYSIGSTVLTTGTVDSLNLPLKTFSLLGLMIIILSAGPLNPLIRSFGGDQYKLPEESQSLAFYFTICYLMLNACSAIGRFVNPLIRENVTCFEGQECYPLVFGITSVMLIIGLVILMSGKKFMVCVPPGGNMFGRVCGCVVTSITHKFFNSTKKPVNHWLEYSENKYGKTLVEQTKTILNVLILIIPLIPFWTLFSQRLSRWIFQGLLMDGTIGGFTIAADQMTVVNPVLVVILIPLTDYILFPLLSKIGFKSQLSRVGIGLFFSCLSFIASAIVQYQAERMKIHILWQIPQYTLISLGEIFIQISIMDFCYTQSPNEMKSVMQGFNSLSIAFGNLIMAFIATSRLLESRVNEFLLFAGIMVVDLVIFWWLARSYKYVEVESENSNKDVNS